MTADFEISKIVLNSENGISFSFKLDDINKLKLRRVDTVDVVNNTIFPTVKVKKFHISILPSGNTINNCDSPDDIEESSIFEYIIMARDIISVDIHFSNRDTISFDLPYEYDESRGGFNTYQKAYYKKDKLIIDVRKENRYDQSLD